MSHPDKSREKCSPFPPNSDVRLPARAIPKQGRRKRAKASLGGGHGKQKERGKEKKRKEQ